MLTEFDVNDSNVVAKNVDTSNGVIHIIDAVLLPREMTRTSAMNLITSAIDRGAPVYNSGHHSRCCDIYMETMSSLMDSGIQKPG